MSGVRKRRWWQFSLRSLLVGVFIVGPILGFLGPPLVRSWYEWSPAGNATTPPTSPAPRAEPDSTESYYESGETPLY
jgi:hypothetical protein